MLHSFGADGHRISSLSWLEQLKDSQSPSSSTAQLEGNVRNPVVDPNGGLSSASSDAVGNQGFSLHGLRELHEEFGRFGMLMAFGQVRAFL